MMTANVAPEIQILKYFGFKAHPILLINRVDFMHNENKPIKDYIHNLILMNLAMGEMIHQLEDLVIEEGENDSSDLS
jgi:hypothetical protein